MSLRIERLTTLQGNLGAAFFVRNRANKLVAIGAFSQSEPFVMPSHKRYARDMDLCIALGKITGLPVKWNLTYYGNDLTSGTGQELMARVRKARRFAR